MVGVTQPLSEATSSENDIQLLDGLITILHKYNAYEPTEKSLLRKSVLIELDRITKSIVYDMCCATGLPGSQASLVNAKVVTYGSYRLGVHAEDADIDTLCLLPKNIPRQHFFERMHTVLQKHPGAKCVNYVNEAFVPVIKLKLHGIPIDLVCAVLPLDSISEELEINGSLLEYMDERCIRSLNGTRVADDLLALVPNVDTFRLVLRAVKLWATRRAIYSNIIGFLGGVAWAILVARICQLFPNACASTILSKFFRIFCTWDFSKNPVILKSIEESSDYDVSSRRGVKSWNPRLNPQDREHKMPIITPSFPNMCASHNVTNSTKRIILGEMKAAADVMDKIMVGSASWNDLFTENDFFKRYRHYIQVIVSSDSPSVLLQGAGLAESRLRLFLSNVEASSRIALLHPFVDGIEDSRRCKSLDQVKQFIGEKASSHSVYDSTPLDQIIYSKTFYIGLYIRPEMASYSTSLSMELSAITRSFQHSLIGKMKKHTKLNIRYLDRSSLPSQLNSTASAIMKREYEDMDIPAMTNINGNDSNGSIGKKQRTINLTANSQQLSSLATSKDIVPVSLN